MLAFLYYISKPLAENSKMRQQPAAWPTKIILRLQAANLSTTANQLSAASVLIQQNQHGDYKQNNMASFAEALFKQFKAPTKSKRNLLWEYIFFIHPERCTNTCMAVLIRRVACGSLFSFWGQRKVLSCKITFEDFDLFSFTADRSASLFWTATKSATFFKNFPVTYILHIILKESTLLKGNLCIYKCFIDVL